MRKCFSDSQRKGLCYPFTSSSITHGNRLTHFPSLPLLNETVRGSLVYIPAPKMVAPLESFGRDKIMIHAIQKKQKLVDSFTALAWRFDHNWNTKSVWHLSRDILKDLAWHHDRLGSVSIKTRFFKTKFGKERWKKNLITNHRRQKLFWKTFFPEFVRLKRK